VKARSGKALGQQQRRDTALVEQLEHLVQAEGGMAARCPALPQQRQRLLLVPALLRLDKWREASAHLLHRRPLHVDLEGTGEQRAQVGVKQLLDSAVQLSGPTDRKTLEGAAVEVLEQQRAGRAQVVPRFLLDTTLVAGLRPAALGVVPVHVVEDLGRLAEGVTIAVEDAPGAVAHEQHAPAGGRQLLDQGCKQRRLLERDARGGRLGQAHDLDDVPGGGAEDRQPVRPLRCQLVVVGEKLADLRNGLTRRHALLVGVPLGLLTAVLGLAQQRVGLGMTFAQVRKS
jgi:hypothetical protein